MSVPRSGPCLSSLLLLLTLAAGTTTAKPNSDPYHPVIDPAKFQRAVDNPWLPLLPGTISHFTEKKAKPVSDNEVTVTHETKTILGVTCVVVHDVLREKGVLMEETFDWLAQDKDGNVWYFGEDTKEYHGAKYSTEGSWEAGVGGAEPGILMPAHPAPGEPYRQEYLRGQAEDMGQIVAINDSVTVPYAKFTGCVRTKEWSMLEAGSEKKWYAKGVGVVRAESTDWEVSTLISVVRP